MILYQLHLFINFRPTYVLHCLHPQFFVSLRNSLLSLPVVVIDELSNRTGRPPAQPVARKWSDFSPPLPTGLVLVSPSSAFSVRHDPSILVKSHLFCHPCDLSLCVVPIPRVASGATVGFVGRNKVDPSVLLESCLPVSFVSGRKVSPVGSVSLQQPPPYSRRVGQVSLTNPLVTLPVSISSFFLFCRRHPSLFYTFHDSSTSLISYFG